MNILYEILSISDPDTPTPGPKSLPIEDMFSDMYWTTKINPRKMGTWKSFKPIKGDRVGKIGPRLPYVPARGKRGPILTKSNRRQNLSLMRHKINFFSDQNNQ